MKNALFVVGARPNFIKIAPICMALNQNRQFPYQIVHTGQHYDAFMSDIFFEELNIPKPDFFLNVGSGTHGKQTGQMMIDMEELCQQNDFGAIIVIGDVNSTLAGALVGVKMHIPVVHIEAGLRSYNRSMPEEINRVATDHVSDLLFAPTRTAMDILEKENLTDRALFSGDVMYDMIRIGAQLAEERSSILQRLELCPGTYFLATLHRPYNVDEPEQLKSIMGGLGKVDGKVVLSAHPRLSNNLKRFGIDPPPNIVQLGPLGYLDFITLEQHARKIITDSGGIQKEAFFVQTPCITLRPETEWNETVETGANILVRERTASAIIQAVEADMDPDYAARPYGDGKASEIIIQGIAERIYA